MFLKKYFYSDIGQFKIYKTSFLFKNRNDNLFFENLNIDNDVRSFYGCNDNIVFFKNNYTYLYCIKEKQKIASINGSLFFDTFNKKDVLSTTKKDGKRLLSIVNFNCSSFNVTKEIGYFDIENYYRVNDYFIFNEKFILKSLSLISGQHVWETNLEPYGEIRKILGVQSEKLWVSMDRCGENKDKNSLLALDVNTGQILYQAPSEYDLSDWFIELIPEQNTILSIYGKMSTHQADSPLVEINATTGVLIRNQRIESLYLENLKIGFWKVLHNKIYFTANKDTLHGRHIGILDYNTLEILWQTEIKDLRGTFKDFQVTQDKIYVLDTGNQLHIFEKEE